MLEYNKELEKVIRWQGEEWTITTQGTSALVRAQRTVQIQLCGGVHTAEEHVPYVRVYNEAYLLETKNKIKMKRKISALAGKSLTNQICGQQAVPLQNQDEPV